MRSSLISAPQPQSVAVGDLDNDHQTDIVVANTDIDNIGVFISRGEGVFKEQKTYSTGRNSHPYSVAVGDFNNDNYLDIAVANHAINSIGIFLGYGNGNFSDQNPFSIGASHPLYITVGDFNNDNRTDIVVANYGTNNIGILLGNGDGSFRNPMTYFTGYDSLPYSIVLADFDKDNQLDIAVANYGTNNIHIFLEFANGTFRNQQTYTTLPRSNPLSITTDDLNNDNQLDIVVANHGTGTIGIFFGHGNGSFLSQTIYSIGSNSKPQFVAVGDLNNDNKLDVIVVDSQNDQVHVFPGSGNESFPVIATYDTLSGSGPFCIAVADFNNNSQSDIAVVNKDANNILILMNLRTLLSTRQAKYKDRGSIGEGRAAVADFNNDNVSDILVVTQRTISVMTGSENGTFDYRKTIYLDKYLTIPQHVSVGDLNNDNRMDFVTALMYSNMVGVFLGHGDGTFSEMTTYSTGVDSEPWRTVLGDFNRDNRLDIVSINRGSDTLGVLLGNGNGTFASVKTRPTPAGHKPYSVIAVDLNKDNNLDLVVGDDSCSLTVFLGLGNGTFSIWYTYSIDYDCILWSIALIDYNWDDYPDIVATRPFEDTIYFVLGARNAKFSRDIPMVFEAGTQTYDIAVVDFNKDNLDDLVLANFGRDNIVILYGSDFGGFVPGFEYPTGTGSKPYMIAKANSDDRRQLTLAVYLLGTEEVAVLTNYYAANFRTVKRYLTGTASHAVSIATGDFNRDDRSDIVVANSGSDDLDLRFGLVNGSLGQRQVYPIGNNSSPQYVITCDVDQDNQLDIISVNSKDDSISVIRGCGNGSFLEQLKYSMGDGSRPHGVASGDFNNDNRLDLVVVNTGKDSIGLLFGFNYTSFPSIVYYQTLYWKPVDLIVYDMNNDDILDIILIFPVERNIGVLLGYGNGTFTPVIIYSIDDGMLPKGIAVGDFNNDNRSDIVIAANVAENILILLGSGDGSFSAILRYPIEPAFSPRAVETHDLNHDNQLDIVMIDSASSNVGILLGYGNESFSIMKTYPVGKYSSLESLAIGDIDNDGILDIVVTASAFGIIGFLIGNGDGTFKDFKTSAIDIDSQLNYITLADLNGDNQLDIVTVCRDRNRILILFGRGHDNFTNFTAYSTGAGSLPNSATIGDFNKDNILDIIVANGGTANVVILFGCGNETFLLGPPYVSPWESVPSYLAIGDFNNDSRLDFVIAGYKHPFVDVFLSYGTVPFGSVTLFEYEIGLQPQSVAVGDMNHDGWSDIVVANYQHGSVGILLSLGRGVFSSMTKYVTGNNSAPYSVVIADFNNDHHLDIVVSNSGTDELIILLGRGDGTFFISANYSTGVRSRPYTVVTSDFDDDHILDIAVTNSGTSNIWLFYGNGDGTFRINPARRYSLGYGYHPYSIAATDMNRDGWMDIVIACYDADHAEILMQIC